MKTIKLPNGLNVVYEQSDASRVTSMQIWVKCGSANETEKENGISHFIEHILFKGTKNHGLGEVADIIERMGGELNAFTSKDHTCYYVTVPSVHYKEAMCVLRDLVFNPLMDEKDISDEREVILEEIRRYQDIPSSVASDLYYELQFKGHPYGMSIQGTESSVKSLSVQQIKDYYLRFYAPSNSVLVVCGDIEENEVLSKVSELFSGLEQKISPESNIASALSVGNNACKISTLDVKESVLYFGFSVPGLFHKDVAPLDLLSNILGQTESSRLVKRLRVEKGLVTAISTNCYTPKHGGSFAFGISFESGPDKVRSNISRILKELFSVLSEASSKGFMEEELLRAKNIILSEKIYEKRTVDGMASRIGRLMSITGGTDFDEKYIEQIKSVTGQDVVRVFHDYICNGIVSCAAVLPNSADIDEGALAEIVLNGLSNIKKAKKIKDNKKVTLGTVDIDVNVKLGNNDPEMFIQDKGTKVIVKKFGNIPLSSLYLCFPGGLSYETEDNNGVSNLASRTLMYGAGKYTYDQLASKLDSTASYFDIFSGRDVFGISLSVLKPYFSEILDLVMDVVCSPKFDKRYFNPEKKVIEDEIRSLEDNLSSYTHSQFLKTIYEKSNYRLETLGRLESMARINRVAVQTFYEGIFNPSQAIMAFSGDFDESLARDWSISFSNKTTSKNILSDNNTDEPEQFGPREKLISKDVKQSHIMLGYKTCNVKGKDMTAIKVLSGILQGQSGRLFMNLRDKQSLAYSVFPLQMFSVHSGYFAVYIASEHSKIDRCITGIRGELLKLKEEPVSDDELTRSKNYLIGLKEIELQTSCSQSMNMALNEFYGRGFKRAFNYSDDIMKVNKEDIQRVAKKYFLDQKENLVILTK